MPKTYVVDLQATNSVLPSAISFSSREYAVAWIRRNIGDCDEEGYVNLISEYGEEKPAGIDMEAVAHAIHKAWGQAVFNTTGVSVTMGDWPHVVGNSADIWREFAKLAVERINELTK